MDLKERQGGRVGKKRKEKNGKGTENKRKVETRAKGSNILLDSPLPQPVPPRRGKKPTGQVLKRTKTRMRDI